MAYIVMAPYSYGPHYIANTILPTLYGPHYMAQHYMAQHYTANTIWPTLYGGGATSNMTSLPLRRTLIFWSVIAAMIAQNIERHIVLGGKYAEACHNYIGP